MSLRSKILEDIKIAMKSRDSEKLETLRYVNAQIKNKEIDVRPKELTEEDVISVFKKLLKQRKEAAEQYSQAGREDLREKEVKEAAIIEAYLPEMISEEDLKKIVENVIQETGASSMKDMGAVMKEVLAKVAGQADGKMVSDLVKSSLG